MKGYTKRSTEWKLIGHEVCCIWDKHTNIFLKKTKRCFFQNCPFLFSVSNIAFSLSGYHNLSEIIRILYVSVIVKSSLPYVANSVSKFKTLSLKDSSRKIIIKYRKSNLGMLVFHQDVDRFLLIIQLNEPYD